jgi:aldehyde dehydrogenase (NAD+)
MTIETRAYIAGTWRNGAGPRIESINPFDGSVAARLHQCTVADVDEAVEAARRAQSEGNWARMFPHERARVLYRIGETIEREADAIAALQTLDTGKTLTETRALAMSAAGTFRYFAAALETLEDTLTPPRGSYVTMSVHEPMGVIGAIAPWNSPVASDAQKLAPALAAGNGVVLKPAEWTPLVSLKLAGILEACGIPAGLVSVLPGPGREVGEAIVTHRHVAKVSFTGGTSTGRHIAGRAAAKLMPVSLELGGKSPTVVFEDADIDQAVAGILFGIFSSSGQSCIAGSRLFVARGIYDSFMQRLLAATEKLPLGDPRAPATRVAPLVAFDHRDKVAQFADEALAAGGTLLTGGCAPAGGIFDKGAFYRPTIFADVPPDAVILREEVFGPMLVALPFDDEDDLVRQANDSVYGLACGLWTRDAARAWRIARRIEAGTVWINTYKQFSISTQFGGWKDSGMGREKGREGIRGYMNQKSLYWATDSAPLPWGAGCL